MRGTGLNRWTIAGKQAFHMEFMSLLTTDIRNNKNLMRTFRCYGLGEAAIKDIEAGGVLVRGGAEFLDPKTLKVDTMEQVFGMVSEEMGLAVPEPDTAVQAFMNQGKKRGEAGGELFRTGGQFKAFSVSIIMGHMARALHGSEGNLGGKIRYGASIITGATMLGVLTTQLKEIAKGNKPFDWDSKTLWNRGFQAGGALSIAGDLLMSDVTKYGTSMQDYLLGPLGGDANKIFWKGFLGGVADITAADNKLREIHKITRNTADEALDYIPGQFWYTRLAFDRIVYDGLHKAVNPEWQLQEVQREIKRRQQEGANERWW